MFFARAFRLFAYRGAMREELLIETRNNEETGPQQYSPPSVTASAAEPQQSDSATRWVSPEQMLAIYHNPELERR